MIELSMNKRKYDISDELISNIKKLKFYIESHSDPYLPALPILSKTLSISRDALMKAEQVLRDQGVLIFKRGSRVLIKSQVDKLGVPREREIYTHLQDQILGGILKQGQQLPKISWLAAQYKTSGSTIQKVLYGLHRDSLISRKGKVWVIGKGSLNLNRILVKNQKVICIIGTKKYGWFQVAISTRTNGFCRAFQEQARFNQILILPIEVDLTNENATLDLVNTIQNLGTKYIGSLIVGNTQDGIDLKKVTDVVDKFKRPWVWFDRIDEPNVWLNQKWNGYRCHFDESKGVKEAIDNLYYAGHRHICYLRVDGLDTDWIMHRWNLIQGIASENFPDLNLTTFSVDDINNMLSKRAFENAMRMLCKFNKATLDEIRDWLGDLRSYLHITDEQLTYLHSQLTNADPITNIITVYKFVFNKKILMDRSKTGFRYLPLLAAFTLSLINCTAIIFPNDNQAKKFFTWILRVGIYPWNYSMISFDNSLEMFYYRIDTVDFGFEYLGNASFHKIVGGVPIREERGNSIPSLATVVNQGSILPPNKKFRFPWTID